MRGGILARHLRLRQREALKDPEYQRELMRLLRRNGLIPPIAGGAINLMGGLASQTATVALTTGVVNLFPVSGAPLVLQPGGQPPAGIPWGLAFAYVQEVTGVSAGATCTVKIQDQVPTTLGSGIGVNQGAASGPIDSSLYLGLVNPASQTITATAQLSSGTGTVANAAGTESLLGVLSFL
jgi:hypothetical protein